MYLILHCLEHVLKYDLPSSLNKVFKTVTPPVDNYFGK